MRLIGMLDSPYVRRVAIGLDILGVGFEHEALSVFSTFEQFAAFNPVVKAPTLVCDDGLILMDSSLILQWAETGRAASLWPAEAGRRSAAFSAVGMALAACEKSAQLLYEQHLRPADKQFAPWSDRVRAQLLAAYGALEEKAAAAPAVFADPGQQPALTAAVVWGFAREMLAPLLPATRYPALTALAQRLEHSAPFRKYPSAGPGLAPPPAFTAPASAG